MWELGSNQYQSCQPVTLIGGVHLTGLNNCLCLKSVTSLLKSQIQAETSLPANRQKQWQPTLPTLFHQPRKYGAKSPAQKINRAVAENIYMDHDPCLHCGETWLLTTYSTSESKVWPSFMESFYVHHNPWSIQHNKTNNHGAAWREILLLMHHWPLDQ